MNKPTLFASDIHLSDAEPATAQRFAAFLRGPVRDAQALYLLGDIFEYWAGDDDDDAFVADIRHELAAVSAAGVALYLMHGNRDFLIGARFVAQTGATLLGDPVLKEIEGRRLLLSHGDALCTDDVKYQAFRSMVRDPDWQARFVARPLADRKAEIAHIRAASIQAKQEKTMEIMDVNAFAVVSLLAAYPGAHLIHGHTHRPGRHAHEVQHGLRQRWVLPDWSAERGGYLQVDAAGLRLVDW